MKHEIFFKSLSTGNKGEARAYVLQLVDENPIQNLLLQGILD